MMDPAAGDGMILIPAFNEERRIGDVVQAVRRQYPRVVVVDDGSGDRTAERAGQAGATVLKHDVNRGKGAALETGFAYARDHGHAFVLTMDADGQHAPGDIPAFLERFRQGGVDVIVGNRMAAASGMPLVRRVTNRFMSAILSRRMGQHVPDTQNGFRLYRTAVIPEAAQASQGFAAESEILLALSLHRVRIQSVPVHVIYGDEKSKIRPLRDTVRFFRMLRRFGHREKA